MKKLNKLRRAYLWYLVVTGELVCAAIIICAGYIGNPAWQTAIRILGIGGAVIVPVMVWLLYSWKRRDNHDTSDELEQMVLLKALAIAGLVAMSLVPVLLLLAFLLPDYAGFTAFAFTVLIWGTFKIATFCLYRKY
jgi:hypothetical protein